MKTKKILMNVLFVSLSALLLVTYQNCSQTSFKPTDGMVANSLQRGDTQAVIFNDSNDIEAVVESQPESEEVPVQEPPVVNEDGNYDAEPTEPTPPVQTPPIIADEDKPQEQEPPVKQPPVVKDDKDKEEPPVKNPPAQTPPIVVIDEDEEIDVIDGTSCMDLSKKYKNTIDIASLSTGAKIDIVKGKTFIYSSTGREDLKALTIGKANGRTILCRITIETLSLKAGRLDLIDSHVKKAVELKGTVKKDATSTINQ